MQASSRRDPKKFAQRTMAAAIAASAMAAFGAGVQAQTTGGGIGAAVNGNAGAAGAAGGVGGVQTPGTTGTAGGTTTSGVAAPTAPANPLRPGTGPGINNTGSPVLPTPRNLQGPIGGSGARTPGGTARIPGNTVPGPRATNGVNGANVPQATTPRARAGTGTGTTTTTGPARTGTNAAATSRLPGSTMRTGTITNFSDTSLSFREGANTTTLSITPDTVVQMDGRNIALSDIPANSQVRIERSATNSNEVTRVVVIPQAAAGTSSGATSSSVRTQTGTGSTGSANRSLRTTGPSDTGSVRGGTSVNTQTGTGSTGSANRSFSTTNDINAGTSNGSVPNNDINAGTGNASTPSNDLNAGTANASTPSNDINAGTANASTPGNDVNAPVVNNANTSNRPLAPGQNPADQPVSPFTRGADQRLQAGFNETNTQNNSTQSSQGQRATTDGSQFLGPVTGGRAPSNSRSGSRESVDTGANAPVVLPDNGAGDAQFSSQFGNRFGAQFNTTRDGLTLGNVTNNSLAARSGMRAGDRIQSLNGTNVSTAADFGRALQTASQNNGAINAQVLRNGTPQDVSLTLPNGFFNGLTVPAVTGNGAATIGTAPAGTVGLNGGNIAVTPDGTAGVNVGGAFVPATAGTTQVGAAGATAAATTTNPGTQTTVQEQTLIQGQTPARVRPADPPVGTQRVAVTAEALKVPDINLGWNLKATPEGVVMSSLVEDGLAAQNHFEVGDVIETIDGRPITAPGAVSYELHRHRAGASVDFGLLRNGKRITETVKLPEDHKPLLLNRNETFGQANNAAKEQGGSGARPLPVKPTEESRRTLEEENKALREEIQQLRGKK